jgi:hypothetical protein
VCPSSGHAGDVGSVEPVGRLPLAALVLARRVRALVVATLVHTTALAALAWWSGAGLTLPGVASFAAHVAISLGAALPVRWQFAGDPVSRQRRAARAMTVSFAVLAGLSVVETVRDALAPGVPGGPAVGVLLGLAGAIALPLLVAADTRTAQEDGVPGPIGPATTAALTTVLLAATGIDLTAVLADPGAPGVSVAAPAVSAVIAVLATREALGASRT